MNSKNKSLIEMIIFSLIMTIFGFLVSYATDIFYKRPIDWIPSHAKGMASGTFLTSAVVFHLFSERFIKYKCSNTN